MRRRRRAPEGVNDEALGFLKLVGHDLRWAVVRELGRSDLRVTELIERVGETGNLVSYHLTKLRADGLVRERRSSVDAREVYYSLDLDRFQRMLSETAARVHRALLPPRSSPAPADAGAPARVLFLCTHNSARSQIAEGMLRQAAGDRVLVASAGSEPTDLHPLAVEVMARRAIDIRRQSPKHVDTLAGERFDVVISLCDAVREVCPSFAGSPELVHWSLPDPVQASPDALENAFETVATEIERRIRYLVPLLDERRGAVRVR